MLEAMAPNRIDFAGGTTDLFPLYLLMEGGCTINLAINVWSRASIRIIEGEGITLKSRDMDECIRATSLDSLKDTGALSLLVKAVKAFPQYRGLEIITMNEAPRGSGLGASSALLIAILGALNRLESVAPLTPALLIQLATNIETSVLGIPAGSQDHIAAFFGGFNIIRFNVHGFEREELVLNKADKQAVENMIVLSYTGESRFSGMNNWDIIKSYIDGNCSTAEKLIEIRDLTEGLAEELLKGRLDSLPIFVQKEWSLRKQLSPGVTNEKVEFIMRAAAKKGALANKLCGAGGGGCMISLVEEKDKPKVEKAIQGAGGRIIPFEINLKGLQIEERVRS